MINIPRAEYPRPQFVRESYINLNGEWDFEIDNAENGEIIDVSSDGILVSCGVGALLITDVQFEGKKKMPVSEFIKGNEIKKGVILKCPNL